MAFTMASTFSCETSASSSHACLARRASVRASAMEVRSRSCGTEVGGGGSAIEVFTAERLLWFWQNTLDFRMWTRDDVHRYQLANATCRGSPGIRGRFHRPHVAADHDRHIPSADVLLADEQDIRG